MGVGSTSGLGDAVGGVVAECAKRGTDGGADVGGGFCGVCFVANEGGAR